jgi:hypothetical protein
MTIDAPPNRQQHATPRQIFTTARRSLSSVV